MRTYAILAEEGEERKKLIPSLLLLAINHHHSPSTSCNKITYQGLMNTCLCSFEFLIDLLELQSPVTRGIADKDMGILCNLGRRRKKLIPSLLLLAINHHHSPPTSLTPQAETKISHQGPIDFWIFFCIH